MVTVTAYYEIRADYDRTGIVVYQAFNDAIADAALKAQRLVAPFSLQRMTWIKPSFLWLMERSGWGTKSNQQRILAIRITRAGWERALNQSVLTSYQPGVHRNTDDWRRQFDTATVHVQWDPERSLYGAKLNYRAIQVGVSSALIEQYVSDWTQEIVDMTPRAAKIRELRRSGHYSAAKKLLPPERVYRVEQATAQRLGM